MPVTRRALLLSTAVSAGVASGLGAFPARAAVGRGPVAPRGTTLDSTVARGPAGPGGYARVASGPGEPHVLRADLGAAPRPGREARRRPLLAFVHLTDQHLLDVQSPARVEWLDRYNDEPGESLVFSSAWRPQEVVAAQMADSLLSAVRRVGRGPLLGRRFDFALCTGDNTDNCQHNELRWHIDLMDGRTVRTDSGDLARFEGVQDADPQSYDAHYWHPEGTPPGKVDDVARARFGFPVVKGLLDAARRPFRATGVGLPWYSCYGNHDGLVQGNFPQSFQLSVVATGPVKVVGLPAGATPADVMNGDPAFAAALAAAPVREVTADPARRIVTRAEVVKEHFRTGGFPVGHGYTARNVADGTAYYAFSPAPHVRGIVLDTVNPNGESGGSIDQAQLAWLRAELAAVTGAGRDRLVVVFSHHTISTMNNSIVFVDEPSRRVLGPEVRDLLLSFPNVVLWVNGHTHQNRVTPHRRAAGGGFWEVSTAAHIDWPVQARALELVDNGDGTVSVVTTILDADAPLSYGGRLTSTRALASLGRELAMNDWQERSDVRRGAREDRNVELLVAAPFRIPRAAPAVPTVADEELPRTGAGTGAGTGAAAVGAVGLLAAAALQRRTRSVAQER